ncbi:MAG: hypothetical protein ACR2KV_15975 [Solirubrobacteraceae bacterium]
MSSVDPLGELREQIRAASAAAERLVGDSRRAASGRTPPAGDRQETDDGGTPPAGWQQTDGGDAQSELAALGRLLELLRATLPAELQEQLTDLIRQLLVVLRALIDWAVTRLEQDGRGRELAVEDIPID